MTPQVGQGGVAAPMTSNSVLTKATSSPPNSSRRKIAGLREASVIPSGSTSL